MVMFARVMKEEHKLLWDLCLEAEEALEDGPENEAVTVVIDKIKKALGEPHVYGGGEYVSGSHG